MDWDRLVTGAEMRSVTDRKTWYQSTVHRTLQRLTWFALGVTSMVSMGYQEPHPLSLPAYFLESYPVCQQPREE